VGGNKRNLKNEWDNNFLKENKNKNKLDSQRKFNKDVL